MRSLYFTKSMAEALRHPLYDNDREAFLDRAEARERKRIEEKYKYAGKWINNLIDQPF